MEFKKFGNYYVVRIDKGEEVLTTLAKFCKDEQIKVGQITGLGATNKITIGLFNPDEKVYKKSEFTGPMEITSLVGNISSKNDEVYLHCHINVCDKRMNVLGGHLNECYISLTGEFIITSIDGKIEREFDESIGLNLFKFN